MQFTLTFTGSMADVSALMAVLKAMEKPNAESVGVTRQVILEQKAEAPEAQMTFDDVKTADAAPAEPAPAAKKRGRPSGPSSAKFKEAAEAAAAEGNAIDDEPATPPPAVKAAPAAPAAEALDADAIRDLMGTAIAKNGASAVMTAMSKFDKTRRLGELDKKHYPAFAVALRGLIDGAAVAAVV